MNGDSEPEPDFAIVRLDWRNARQNPGPRDVFWLVEIADSSRAFDRDTKIPLYASVAIPEVWLVDLVDDMVIVYRDPMPDHYATTVVNSVLYAIGGNNGTSAVNTVEAYDPSTDSWSTKATMPTARRSLASGVVNNVLYAVGGLTSLNAVATTESYWP